MLICENNFYKIYQNSKYEKNIFNFLTVILHVGRKQFSNCYGNKSCYIFADAIGRY